MLVVVLGELVVVLVVGDVVVGAVEFECGSVVMSVPPSVESSVIDPVLAPGVALLAPERLATQRSLPETAKAESRLK